MSEDSTMPGTPEPQQTPDSDSVEQRADQPEDLLDRRTVLGLGLKWSTAALAAVAALLATEEDAEAASAWFNRRGRGGWDNGRGWVNRRPGGRWGNGRRGGWVNRRGPGGSWVDRPGGSWMNRR